MTTLVLILVVSLGTSFLCSILEAVFLSVSHSYVALLQERREWAGDWFARARKNVDEPIAAILTLNTIAHTIGATLAGAAAQELFGSVWLTAFSAALTFAVLLFSEIVPKTIGATYWKALAAPTARILQAMIVVMKPILIPLGLLSRLISFRSHGGPTISRAEIEVLAEIGRREGTLDEDEWQVVKSVIRLDEVSVAEVMTPRTDVTAIPSDATVASARDTMLDTGHFRIPVYDGTIDEVIGVLVARDLWRAAESGTESISDLVRPAPFVPPSKRVEDLIPEMRERRIKMAIVIDEFGGTAGIVTLEDLIEEIIGEIQDEHESDEPRAFRDMAGGRVRVWGGSALREAEAKLDFTLAGDEEDHFDTIGGYVFGRLNRIPEVGDQVEVPSGILRVTRMEGRRVEYLLFVPRTRKGIRRG